MQLLSPRAGTLVVALLAAASLTESLGAERPVDPSSRATPRKLEELIFDRSAFVAALPKQVLISERRPNDPRPQPNDAKLLATALARLGRVEGVEFIRLPAEAKTPSTKATVPPTYPDEMRRNRVEGLASFLVFLNAAGRIAAIYCTDATAPEFAHHAAAAIVQWRFSPAQLQGTKVPALVRCEIRFTLRQR